MDTKSLEEKHEEDVATDEESFFDTSIDQTEDEEEVDLQGEQDESVSKKPPLKRASTPSCVPKLIDNKRKHLERRLSAAQHDTILMNEAKEDKEMKKELASVMRESKDSFKEAMDSMSGAMIQLAQGFTRSMELLSQSLLAGQQPMNQNLFYQNAASQFFQQQFHNQAGQPNALQGQGYPFGPSNYSQNQDSKKG